MKRALPNHLFACFVALIFVLGARSSALAESGDTPQISLSVSKASPGATIEVEGGRFVPDALVRFVLFQSGPQIQLGTILADDHGEFTTAILLTLGLQPGQYEIHAIDERNHIAIELLTIVPDQNEQEGNVQREDSDPLLAPMPTIGPGVVPGAIAGETESIAAPDGIHSNTFTPAIVIVLLVLSFGPVLFVLQKRKSL
jgi:hypothetical protein